MCTGEAAKRAAARSNPGRKVATDSEDLSHSYLFRQADGPDFDNRTEELRDDRVVHRNEDTCKRSQQICIFANRISRF